MEDIKIDTTEFVSLKDIERYYITYVLNHFDGNKRKTCEILKINPSTLYRKMKIWDNEESEIC
jgi:DNA-binding NtrC family response regulator